MFSLRMKLDNVVGEKEQVILENIRRCRRICGHQFKIIFRNETLSESECRDFVKRNEKMLFETNTQITKRNTPFTTCWFLIDPEKTDKCKSRYHYHGDVLSGISEFIKMVKHLQRRINEDSDNW
jgi:hypothetical protein